MTDAERISVARIVKVNHAGEYGAIRIYGAQMLLAKLRWPKVYAQRHVQKPLDLDLHDTIQAIQMEEEGQRALVVSEKGADSRLRRAARPVIKASVKAVIWLSTWGDSAAMDRDLRARA